MPKFGIIFSLIGLVLGAGHRYLEEIISQAENGSESCCNTPTFFKMLTYSTFYGAACGFVAGIVIYLFYKELAGIISKRKKQS